MLFWSTLSAALAQTTNYAPPYVPPQQSDYSRASDAAFANLVKSGITSGIIYDRVFPAANLRQPGTPSSSAGHFQQAQAELYYASYNTTDRFSPDNMRNLIWENEQQGIATIGAQRLKNADFFLLLVLLLPVGPVQQRPPNALG